MRESTVLATPYPFTDLTEFDFDTFLECKPYLASKDEQIITQIAQNVLEAFDPNQTSMHILDIGSGNAKIINKVCRRLHQDLTHKPFHECRISVDCIEPCSDGIKLIQQVAIEAEGAKTLLRPQQIAIEDFLSGGGRLYDAIVCCHMLYHIELKNWKCVLDGLMNALRPGGVLVVNLVSRQSDIYRVQDEIESAKDRANLPKMHTRYGYEYFAEDLENVLYQIGHTWERQIISADITFSKGDVLEAMEVLQDKNNNSSLLHFLAFMFRLRHDDLLAIGKTKLLELLVPVSEGITFKSIDKMFVFRRKNTV
ncbi:MAG: hypothetical protein V7641_2393 [Blastocatellia bacterium]